MRDVSVPARVARAWCEVWRCLTARQMVRIELSPRGDSTCEALRPRVHLTKTKSRNSNRKRNDEVTKGMTKTELRTHICISISSPRPLLFSPSLPVSLPFVPSTQQYARAANPKPRPWRRAGRDERAALEAEPLEDRNGNSYTVSHTCTHQDPLVVAEGGGKKKKKKLSCCICPGL